MNHTSTFDYETPHTYACQCTTGWIVPNGGTYYVGVTSTATGDYTGATVYNAGEQIISCLRKGDVYVYDDYEYRYGQYYNDNFYKWQDSIKDGWGVRVLSTDKSTYGAIVESINGQSLINVSGTFSGCASLTTAPVMPSGVTSMWHTFVRCKSLTTAPVIPSSVTNMTSTFAWCSALTGTIIINATPEKYGHCFNDVNMTNITLTGEASKDILNLIGSTGSNWTPIE